MLRPTWKRIAASLRLMAAVVLVAQAAALADDTPPLHLDLQRFLVLEREDGDGVVEVLVPALELQPGDVMLESLTARNLSENPLTNVRLVIPVANGTVYMDGSAAPLSLGDEELRPEFSHDNGLTFHTPPVMSRLLVIEGGVRTEREVEVAPEAYTHVRWSIPVLAPEQSVQVSIRTVVE